ncbi:MAG: VTT domain-containing protein [Chloroflexi bacterium]|nr:VTT domain-containing protein [Chloroflexota bacterium]
MALSVLFAGALIYFREDMLRMGNWGYLGVFVATIGNSAAIFIPTPGPLVTLTMASILNPALVGLIGGIAASLGELFGYVVGASGRKALEGSRILDRLQALPQHRVGPTLFLFAALPMPFDVAGIWAGAIHYSPRRFMFYVTAGKIIKVTAVAFIGYYGIGWLLE